MFPTFRTLFGNNNWNPVVEDNNTSKYFLRILIQKQQMFTNPSTAFWTHPYSTNLANKTFPPQTYKFSIYKNENQKSGQ